MSRNIRWKLHLAAAPEAVWQVLTTDDGRERFWCERSEQTGSEITLTFSNGWVERATVLVADRAQRFVVRYFGTPVTFALHQDGVGGTDLELVHEGVSDAEFEEVLPGWLNVLIPMKAAVDFGVDLRNHDSARSWDQRFVDG